jgi:glycerophosphoryl diester phosphodiesterase
MNKILTVGHRGAKGYEPENTLRSFKKALELGADMIELDVHRCRTGEAVVIHDEDVNRTTNGRGRVADISLAGLKQLDAGRGERIPTLDEVLDLFQGRMKVDIELKGRDCAACAAETIAKHLGTTGFKPGELLVTSFEHDTLLRQFQGMNPGIPIGLLFSRVPDDFCERAAALDAEYVALNYKNTNLKMVERAHNTGLKVMVWTVNKPEDIERAEKMGVDSIASDFPDRLNLRVKRGQNL